MSNRRHLKVFLCHASGDKPKVLELYTRLVADGVEAWLDQKKLLPGQDWRVEITRAVREADVVVICLSNKSITKEGYVQKEIKFALDVAEEKLEGSIFIIPARLEECTVPDQVSRWQWVDLFSEAGYQQLIKSLDLQAIKVSAVRIKNRSHPKMKAVSDETIGPAVEKKPVEFGSQDRILEAAIEHRITVGKPASLFVWIKRLESKSIISVVPSIDEDVVLDVDNVTSKALEMELPIENGRVLPAGISLKLTADEFRPVIQDKKIIIPPEGDSEVCTFIITPKKAGRLHLILEVLKDGVSLATRTLRTTTMENEKEESTPMVLVSISIVVFVRAPTEKKEDTPIVPREEPDMLAVPLSIRLIFMLVGLALLVYFTQAYFSNQILFTCTPPTVSATGTSIVLWLLISLGWGYLEGPVNNIVQAFPPGQQDFRVLLTRILILLTDLFLLGKLSKKILIFVAIAFISGTLILWGVNQNGILYFSSPEETPQIVGFSLVSSNGEQTLSPEGTIEVGRGQQYLVRANHLPDNVRCNWSSGSKGTLPVEPECGTRYAVPLTAGEIDTLTVQVQSACKTKSVFASLNVEILAP